MVRCPQKVSICKHGRSTPQQEILTKGKVDESSVISFDELNVDENHKIIIGFEGANSRFDKLKVAICQMC